MPVRKVEKKSHVNYHVPAKAPLENLQDKIGQLH